MKAIKLNQEQYERSLKNKNINHLWLYRREDTYQRTHNNSIFLNRTTGMPFACLVVEYDRTIYDEDIERVFGKGVFWDGAVSPYDKENMVYDVFYLKK